MINAQHLGTDGATGFASVRPNPQVRVAPIGREMVLAHDAIVVGAGHNGLAAAIILAKAGWEVLVLERNPEPGGAVRTAEITLPGFHHDLYAANLNLFAGSPFFAVWTPSSV